MTTGMGIISMLSPILTYVALAAGIYAIIRLAVKHAINETKKETTTKTKAAAFFTGPWFWLIVAVVVFILSMAMSILPYM
ncbi:MAG: hypothetical protein L0L78_03525 [Tetragenococcus koreensis]|nr:hypothetical protein [Tetragenococcus koreensis]